MAICRCECGTVRAVPMKRLRHGSSRSCGCTRGRQVSRTLGDIQALAEQRGGQCLSSAYLGHHTKHLWQCNQGHQWKATTNSVNRGSWCPTCGTSRGEQLCRAVFEAIFGTPFPSCFPDWIVNPKTGRKLQLDGYAEEEQMAFEYQGKQHYQHVPRFHEGVSLEKLQGRDALKAQRCVGEGVTLVVIPRFPDNYSNEEAISQVQAHLKKQRLPHSLPKGFTFQPLSDRDTYHQSLLEAAQGHNWEVQTQQVSSAHQRIVVQCSHSHDPWKCRATDLLNGKTACPLCREDRKRILYREGVETKAHTAGLKVRTAGPIYSETPVELECRAGHRQIWRAARIRSYHLHCTTCAGKLRPP